MPDVVQPATAIESAVTKQIDFNMLVEGPVDRQVEIMFIERSTEIRTPNIGVRFKGLVVDNLDKNVATGSVAAATVVAATPTTVAIVPERAVVPVGVPILGVFVVVATRTLVIVATAVIPRSAKASASA